MDPRVFHERSVAGHIAETECGGQPPAVPQPKEAGRAIEKPKGKGKGKGRSGGKAKGKGKGSPRGCAPEGWVNDLEEDAPEGEDTNEDGCWIEEDDETLRLGYFGSDSCLMTSPPGLRESFSQRSWTDCDDPQIAKSPAMPQATWVL